VVPFSTSQQISWEELEELPLPAKQEILSLRAAVAANSQQQRMLEKQLQQIDRQLAAKEQELAASAASNSVLRAEHAAALAELHSLQGAVASTGVTDASADCSRSNGISADQLRSAFAAQIAHLTKDAAAASSAASVTITALQALLEAAQQSAADAVASLEMRLAKVTASKARVQLQLEDDIAARDAELADSKQQAVILQHSLHEALAELQESQQQAALHEGTAAQLQEALAAASAAKEQQADELQATRSRLEQLEAELSARAADLACVTAHAASVGQQLQQHCSAKAELQAAAAADSQAAAARISELTAELSGLKAGYGPVLLGLESELAIERTNAHQQVAQLKQRLGEAEAAINVQMQLMQQQLRDAEASCAAACARSGSLQEDLQAMQRQQQVLAAELEFTKAASAAEVAQVQGAMRNVQELLQARTAAEGDSVSPRKDAEGLQTQLEASLAQSQQRIAGLEQQINELKQQQLAAASAGQQQLEALCSASKQQVAEAQSRLDSERAAAQEQLAALSSELEGVRAGYTMFVSQLETELAAERSLNRRQAAEVKEQLDQAQAQLMQLQQQLQQLEAQKQALESDHAALQQASSLQQQAAAEELSSLRQQVQQVQQQEAEALERCTHLEAELAAATEEEAAEVAALREVLEQQRTEMSAQVRVLLSAWLVGRLTGVTAIRRHKPSTVVQ
jgi:chromosome segregation ATPase